MDVSETRHRNLLVLLTELEQRGATRAKDQAQRLGGMNPSFLSQLKGGKKMGDDVARKIESAAGKGHGWMDVAQFSQAVTDHFLHTPALSQPVARFETTEGYVRFPLLEGFAGMGRGDYVGDYPEIVEFVEVTREWAAAKLRNVPHEAIRVITGRGQSMRGMYDDGDLIFIDSRVKKFVDDAAYVFRLGGRVQVKRLQWRGDKLRILSANPAYEPMDVSERDLEIGGMAIAAWTLKEF